MNITTDSNSSKPLVSFIMTCYNLPDDMVRECLDSILALSLRDHEREIIIVDDGSDTCVLNDLTDYSQQIIYIRQPNQGLSVARNTGLQMATGDYIQFVDGDDYLITEAYEHCLDLVRYENPDMVLFDFTRGKAKNMEYYAPKPIDGTTFMRHNNLHATACGYVFSRHILMGLRFTPGLLHEDEEFTPLLMLRADRIFDTKLTAYFYRERKVSITGNKNRKSVIKRLNDIERTLIYLKEKHENMPRLEKYALERRISQLTMDYLYCIMKHTGSEKQLETRMERLKKYGLYPLPDRRYTKKYTLFRLLMKSKMSRNVLMRLVRNSGK
ncbi:MAG: glycosyltransferase family 2 protein [Prevotella sp.]